MYVWTVHSMSAYEPALLQYLQFHSARLGTTDREMEGRRLAAARTSPMQAALDALLTALTHTHARAAATEVRQQLARGVGLATRAAAVLALCRIAGECAVSGILLLI